MKVVLQRSKASKVTIDGKVHGKIDKGYVALIGFTDGDNTEIVEALQTDNFNGKIIDTTMVIFDNNPTEPNNYKYVEVSGTLYPTKQISKNYNKIILDSGTNW